MKNENNRTVSRFEHNGEAYTVHERSNPLSNGVGFTRRFILDSEGVHRGRLTPAGGVREARRVLNGRGEA